MANWEAPIEAIAGAFVAGLYIPLYYGAHGRSSSSKPGYALKKRLKNGQDSDMKKYQVMLAALAAAVCSRLWWSITNG